MPELGLLPLHPPKSVHDAQVLAAIGELIAEIRGLREDLRHQPQQQKAPSSAPQPTGAKKR